MVRRILVVEDNDDCRQIIALILSRMGCEVIHASNGLEGVEKAVDHQPDMILMDLKLPKLGGIEATLRLKENAVTRRIPVVICTAFGPEAYKNTPLADNAAEIVQKPVKLETFNRMVKKYLPLQTDGGQGFSTTG